MSRKFKSTHRFLVRFSHKWLTVCCLVFIQDSIADDWPTFLGPRQNNISRETGLLIEWPEKGPSILWRTDTGLSFSPPVVRDQRLILYHRLDNNEVIACLDAHTGDPQWEYRHPTRYKDTYGYNGGPRSSPTIEGDSVYCFGAEGVLTCLEFKTGRLQWQRQVNREMNVPKGFFGAGTAPVIDGDILLLNVGGPDGAGIVGFDKHTGKTAWKTSDHGAGYSTPVVHTMQRRRMAFFLTMHGLLIVDPSDGKEIFNYPFRSKLYESVNSASPVVVGQDVFTSASYGVGAALVRYRKDGFHEAWRNEENMHNHWATSIYHDGLLYGTHGRHGPEAVIRCIEMKTGEVRWSSPRGLGRATFIMADGHFFMLGERGRLYLVKVNPDRFELKAGGAPFLGYPCYTPPVLSNGRLYIRDEKQLLCLDVRGKSPSTP